MSFLSLGVTNEAEVTHITRNLRVDWYITPLNPTADQNISGFMYITIEPNKT